MPVSAFPTLSAGTARDARCGRCGCGRAHRLRETAPADHRRRRRSSSNRGTLGLLLRCELVPETGANGLPVVTVPADDKVLVDVPRAVKSRGWQVRALSLTDDGQQIGSSGPITDSHSYKVTSGVGGGAPFIVEVDQLRNGQADGSRWSFLVSVSTTGS